MTGCRADPTRPCGPPAERDEKERGRRTTTAVGSVSGSQVSGPGPAASRPLSPQPRRPRMRPSGGQNETQQGREPRCAPVLVGAHKGKSYIRYRATRPPHPDDLPYPGSPRASAQAVAFATLVDADSPVLFRPRPAPSVDHACCRPGSSATPSRSVGGALIAAPTKSLSAVATAPIPAPLRTLYPPLMPFTSSRTSSSSPSSGEQWTAVVIQSEQRRRGVFATAHRQPPQPGSETRSSSADAVTSLRPSKIAAFVSRLRPHGACGHGTSGDRLAAARRPDRRALRTRGRRPIRSYVRALA